MIYFVVGFIVGVIFMTIGALWSLAGTLRIDQISSDHDIYRFEANDLDKLLTRKYIVLKIDPDADLSQK